MILVNPGSENKGGTFEQAKLNAQQWLINIHEEGFLDVEILPNDEEISDYGNWIFYFHHPVTDISARLDIHGFTDDECDEYVFRPRIYWNGCSSSEPQIKDWLPDGWRYKIEYFNSDT